MSETLTDRRTRTASRGPTIIAWTILAALLLVAPLFLGAFWLQMGFAAAGAAVGAIGLNLLVGTTGQLSFAHPFFLAVGAFTYTWFGSPSGDGSGFSGLGMPTLVAALLALILSGVAGLAMSPVASRLRGIYLGVATIAFIFIGQHVFENWKSVSGGFNGRLAPDLSVAGFSFSEADPDLFIAGVPFGRFERLWYVGIVAVALSVWIAINLLNSRVGRSMAAVRDSEILAAMNGVDVRRTKQFAFTVSAVYAGAAGVLFSLSVGSVSPESFDVVMAISYLSMIVIGGLGSVWGSVIGAFFVTALPLLLQEYAASLPYIAETGSAGGLDAATTARYLFGVIIILIMIFEPSGLVGLGRRARRPLESTSSKENHHVPK